MRRNMTTSMTYRSPALGQRHRSLVVARPKYQKTKALWPLQGLPIRKSTRRMTRGTQRQTPHRVTLMNGSPHQAAPHPQQQSHKRHHCLTSFSHRPPYLKMKSRRDAPKPDMVLRCPFLVWLVILEGSILMTKRHRGSQLVLPDSRQG
jgi:hypothetical protein